MTSVNCHSRAQGEAETHNRRGQGRMERKTGNREKREGEERSETNTSVRPETLFRLKQALA